MMILDSGLVFWVTIYSEKAQRGEIKTAKHRRTENDVFYKLSEVCPI